MSFSELKGEKLKDGFEIASGICAFHERNVLYVPIKVDIGLQRAPLTSHKKRAE